MLHIVRTVIELTKQWNDFMQSHSNDQTSQALESHAIHNARDYSGFTREIATRELSQWKSIESLRMLIERLNDWVAEVRKAARESINGFFSVEHTDLLLACLGDFLALNARSRDDHADVLSRLNEILENDKVFKQVLNHFTCSHGSTARFLFERLSRHSEETLPEFVNAVSCHKDLSVRRLFVRTYGKIQDTWVRDRLRMLCTDTAASIRCEALHALWHHGIDAEEQDALLRDKLLDPANSVQQWAFWLAEKKGFDIRAYLEQSIANPNISHKHKFGILGLIALTKSSQYLPVVRRYMASEQVKLRIGALDVWVKISGQDPDMAVVDALADTSNKVAGHAMKLLNKGCIALSLPQFHRAMDANLLAGRTKRVIHVSSYLALWDRLEYLLNRLSTATEPEAKKCLVAALNAWSLNQGAYFNPHCNAEQFATLRNFLTKPQVQTVVMESEPLVSGFKALKLWPEN